MSLRKNIGGNYCHHNPQHPMLRLAIPAKSNIPLVLRRLKERIKAYYYRPSEIPSLNFVNESNRQQRSERREACVRVLLGLLKFTDLASLRVGIPTNDGFFCIPVHLLAKHIGLPLLRTSRALNNLVKAGLLTSTPRRKLNDSNEYRSLAAVRYVNKELFGIFGLMKMLRYEREKAINRLQDIRIKHDQANNKAVNYAGLSRYRIMLQSLTNRTNQIKSEVANSNTSSVMNNPNHDRDSYYYVRDQILGRYQLSRHSQTEQEFEKEQEMKKHLMMIALKFREIQHNLNETCWSREKCYEKAADILEKARLRIKTR